MLELSVMEAKELGMLLGPMEITAPWVKLTPAVVVKPRGYQMNRERVGRTLVRM
jgi:hypothetical protein